VADVWHSKTANALFAVEATKREADDGITVNALMPGTTRSNLQRHLDEVELDRIRVLRLTRFSVPSTLYPQENKRP
jgi:NAD(P)-dependent dehydrogenase (short-subunit alcohol dehydrogenase family)